MGAGRVTLAWVLVAFLADAASGSLLVMPPQGRDTGPEGAWVAEAVADALPRALTRLGVPAVSRDERLRAQDLLEIPPVALTRATAIRIAESMGVSRLLVGSYQLQGTNLTLSLRVLDTERGTLSAPFLAAGPVNSIQSLVQSLSWDLALAGPRRPAATRDEFLRAAPNVPFDAFKVYAQALSAPDVPVRVKLLKQALALAPAYDEARLALGQLQLQTKEYETARETLARVPAGSPHLRAARFLQGVALLELERHREAAALYEELAREQRTAAALNNQALALMRLANAPSQASAVLRQALELVPGAPAVAFNLGYALLAEGDAEAAVFWLRGVVGKDPQDAQARLALSWALRRLGRTAEADEEWRELTGVSPSFAALGTPDLGRRLERILPGDASLAADNDESDDGELAAAHVRQGEKLLGDGDLAGALRELTRAVYLDPYAAHVHLLLSRVHRRRGQTDEALAELRMSLWCRDDAAVRLELAVLLQEAGQGAAARAEAERVLKADPSNEAARRLLRP